MEIAFSSSVFHREETTVADIFTVGITDDPLTQIDPSVAITYRVVKK